ncbi:MAG TPA: formylmethanofuran dehydrogenase subunit E family protein [Methanocorpusculum sp.]|nr:formylmethanofuran dehydrogenase subunit E family protein [Methanocorpusculum sp.]
MTQIPTFEEIANAHGHRCPGIAIGYKMAKAAAEWAGDEPVRVYSTTNRCPLDALRHTFHLTDETLTIEDKGELHFILEKADGSKLFIDEVPGSKIKNEEGDKLREKVRGGTASKEETARFNEIQEELLEQAFNTPDEKLFTIHS